MLKFLCIVWNLIMVYYYNQKFVFLDLFDILNFVEFQLLKYLIFVLKIMALSFPSIPVRAE